MRHELKIYPQFFKALKDKSKTFEIRVDDRPYEVGDTIFFMEYTGVYHTGDSLNAKINYVLRDEKYVKAGTVAMSIELIEKRDVKQELLDAFNVIKNYCNSTDNCEDCEIRKECH